MNRLVANNMLSLNEQYEKLKEEIAKLDEPETKKKMYHCNLTKAYENVTNCIYGIEHEEEVPIT